MTFKFDNKNIVIELKLRGTEGLYKADIEKLMKLPGSDEVFFCVLIDRFPGKVDGRVEFLDKPFSNNIKKIDEISFETWNDRYKKQIDCNLILYQIIKS